jgi:hypothetical protein
VRQDAGIVFCAGASGGRGPRTCQHDQRSKERQSQGSQRQCKKGTLAIPCCGLEFSVGTRT